MEHILKQIDNFKKQNDGMETAFNTKNISFNKLSIDSVDPETELGILKTYNEYLKGISKNNRPPPQEKPIKQEAPKKTEEEDEDDTPKEEAKPTYSTITNMEDIKRAFFSKDYETFNTLIREHPFKYYTVNYK